MRPGDPVQGFHSDIPTVHRRTIGAPVMLQVVWMIDGFTIMPIRLPAGATKATRRAAVAPSAYS